MRKMIGHIDKQIEFLQALKASGDEYIAMYVLTVENLEINSDYRDRFHKELETCDEAEARQIGDIVWSHIAGSVEEFLADKVDTYCLNEAIDEGLEKVLDDENADVNEALHKARVERLLAKGYDRESAEVLLALNK